MADLYILNLHGIGTPGHELPASEQRMWIEEEQFNAALDFAKGRNDIRWTFDDANESDYTVALPALQARGMQARFFIVMDRVDRPGYLSSSQINGLLSAQMEIGSHGKRHRSWAGLGEHDLHEELVETKERLEQLTGVKVNSASCPYGSYNRKVIRALQQAGYEEVYTSDGGPARPGAFLLPRTSLERTWNVAVLNQMTSLKPRGARGICRNLKLLLKRWR